jgi:hypothetical protein
MLMDCSYFFHFIYYKESFPIYLSFFIFSDSKPKKPKEGKDCYGSTIKKVYYFLIFLKFVFLGSKTACSMVVYKKVSSWKLVLLGRRRALHYNEKFTFTCSLFCKEGHKYPLETEIGVLLDIYLNLNNYKLSEITNKKSRKSAGGGMGLPTLLLIIFIILKLTHVIDWSWLCVLSPL